MQSPVLSVNRDQVGISSSSCISRKLSSLFPELSISIEDLQMTLTSELGKQVCSGHAMLAHNRLLIEDGRPFTGQNWSMLILMKTCRLRCVHFFCKYFVLAVQLNSHGICTISNHGTNKPQQHWCHLG